MAGDENLKSVCEEALITPDDDSGLLAPANLEESLSGDPKNMPIVVLGSSSSAAARKLEEMSKPALQVVSVVDSVAENLDKVSIRHGGGQHLHIECGNSSENGECSYSPSQEGCLSMLAFDQGVPSIQTVCPVDKPPQHNVGVGEMQTGSSTDMKLMCSIEDHSGLDNHKDANGGTDYDKEDDEDSAMEEDEDDLDEEEEEQESDDSDSSSSTSTLSFSSLSDDEEAGHYRFMKNRNQEVEIKAESECEEGELKQSPSQKTRTNIKKKALAESSEDEEGLKEPVRSRNEMKDIPRVPKVSVTLQPYHTMVPAGFVSSAVGVSLIVEGTEGQPPLSEGSILWLTELRLPLGIVDELFGPVKKPFYVVRYNDASELPEEAKEGAHVSYVREFADFVLNNPDLYSKAYENTGDNDEELSDSEVYFSDDEKEAEYKQSSKPRMKRGNSEVGIPDIDSRQHQEKRTQGKRSGKNNRNQRSRGDDSRTLLPNNDFSAARPPRHQNSSFQNRQGERDPPFQRQPPFHYRQGERKPPYFRTGVEPSRNFNDKPFENRSPVHQGSQQSRDVGRSKSLPPLRAVSVSVSDEVRVTPKQQVLVSMKDHLQASPRSMSQDVQSTQSNQSSESTSWEPQPPQMVVPQSQAWPVNQPLISPNMASPQLPGVQHSLIPVSNTAVMVGTVSQVAGTICSLPTTNNVPAQSGVGLPMHRPTVFHQVPLQQQFPSFGAHQFSTQASSNMGMQMGNQVQAAHMDGYQFFTQAAPNMGMQMGNLVQAAHMDGYSMGVGTVADFSVPVLGIPVGSAASSPSNYVVHNQPYSGFTAVCSPPYGNGPPSTYGVPDHPRPMQQPLQPSTGTSAGSWQQQNLPQCAPWQKPNQQRPRHGRPPYRDPRF